MHAQFFGAIEIAFSERDASGQRVCLRRGGNRKHVSCLAELPDHDIERCYVQECSGKEPTFIHEPLFCAHDETIGLLPIAEIDAVIGPSFATQEQNLRAVRIRKFEVTAEVQVPD